MTRSHPDESAQPPLRADAEANRRRIIDTAREVFRESGLDAPLSVVAERAGVGAATLYRRFPNRQDLLGAVFIEEVDACVELVLAASEDPDAWRGFSTAVRKLFALDGLNRGFVRAFFSSRPEGVGIPATQRRAERAFAALIQRAKDEGALRADFSRTDLDLALTANGGLDRWKAGTRAQASARFADLMLDAFRNRPAEP